MEINSIEWDEEKQALSLAYYVANLRGFGNKTHLEVYCGIPVSELKKDNNNGQNRIIFEQDYRQNTKYNFEIELLFFTR